MRDDVQVVVEDVGQAVHAADGQSCQARPDQLPGSRRRVLLHRRVVCHIEEERHV